MKLESIAVPHIDFEPRLDNENIFSEVFGNHTEEDWNQVLIDSISSRNIGGIEFPTFPPPETQNRIHGHDGITSLNESAAFYRFACEHGIAGPSSPWFRTGAMLDYGSGWGRILRHFMRDFPLRNIFGYEPSGVFATMARAHNPYVAFLSGGLLPDGRLPESRFDLAVGWSVYSHLSEETASAWLVETARVLKVGGAALYTTWGMRFLERLKLEEQQMKAGEDIHWYSKVCLLGAGDIDQRIENYQAGDFVWFNSLGNAFYGEAFLSEIALQTIIDTHKLPLKISIFDTTSLGQDAFILYKV